jgi:hypothetical protein
MISYESPFVLQFKSAIYPEIPANTTWIPP